MSAEEVKAPVEGEIPPGEEGEIVAEEEVQVVPDEELIPVMALDEFYPEGHVEKVSGDSSLSKRTMQFFECMGQSSFKRYNYHWLGDQDFIYAAGNTYQIYNVESKQRRIFHGTDTDGIGSICVHPTRKHFAVAEKGTSPNIYIYEWPSLKLYRICKKGTEKAYAHIEFSSSGTKLASLGSDPDYTLTVWDWLTQKVVLKCKAFSQEVFRVSFSPYTDDILFTCGSAHIKFWKMAQTFTGLKLQDEIAKFGQLELSDVAAFYELPDGKVVTGTEYGTLIVWEGQFVKAHLVLDVENNTPLHKGMIEVLIQDEDYYVTAGADGYIKWWRISDIDQAEAEEGLEFAIAPTREIRIAENEDGTNPAYIVNMILADKTWYIQDGNGKIYKMAHDSDIFTTVVEFTQGAINDIAISPSHNYALTIAENGMIKVWDYVRKCVTYQQMYSGAGTCLEHMEYSDGNKGRICAAGFDNGLVRILSITADGVQLLKAFKAHDDAISCMKYTKDMKCFCTASKTGDIFFFETDGLNDVQMYRPICTFTLPESGINDMKWNPGDDSIIIGCANGKVYQIKRPKADEIDSSDSYLWSNISMKQWEIKISEFQMLKNQKKDEAEEEKKRRMRLRGELPPEEDEPEEVWEPEAIRTIMPFVDDQGKKQFIISSQGKFNGFIYICSMDEPRPIKAIPIKPDIHVTFMSLSTKTGGDVITIGYDNGLIELIMNFNFEKRMEIKYHDGHLGKISGAVFNKDQTFFISVAQDGLTNVFQFDKVAAIEESKFEPLEGVEGHQFMPKEEKEKLIKQKIEKNKEDNAAVFPELDEAEMGMDEASLAITIKTKEPIGQDVTDPTIYSIQLSKLRTEEDHRLSLADRKKQKVRDQINDLREQFSLIVAKNTNAQDHLQITEDDFQIDPDFFQILYERNENQIEETKKEVAWGIEYHTVNLNKLKNKYYDVLEFEKFTVKGVKNGAYVTTFRVQRMSEFLQTNIEAFKQMLENEIIGKDAENEEDFLDDQSKDGENAVDNEKQKEKDKAAALAAKQKAAQQAALNAKKTEAEKKREQRKLEREERKRKIEKLEKKEAMHSGEDPEDRKNIEIAMATFGHYNLKVSDKYTVPENQRVNFSKKRQQMVLLEGSIHKLKVDFNQKIQELKIRKKEIVDHVLGLNTRLEVINKELSVKEELFVPQIDKTVEYPENFFEIKDEDIDEFKVKKSLDKKGQKSARKGEDEEEEDEKKPVAAVETDYSKLKSIARKNAKVQNTDLDSEFNQIRNIELVFEKEQKKKEIDEIIKAFDDEIREMQKEKYRLESDLKNAEMKLILFFEELILLKSMESKDITLTKRLASCRQEKGQILKEINEISRKLKDKKKEIDEIKEKEEDLMIRFHEFCPERSDKYEEIRKFFEKIIKRRRRVEKPEKGDAGEDDEDEDEDAEEEEEEMEEEDEDEDENTIAGLPPEEYKIEDIEKLREDRLDLYEEKEKILQFISDLDNQRRRLENKERAIKTDLEETEEEIQDFQSEKMAKLNELQVSIVLKVKQIQNLQYDAQATEKWQRIREDEINAKLEAIQAKASQEGVEDPTYMEQQREILINEEDDRGYFMAPHLKKSIMFTRTQLLQLINRKRELDEEQESLQKAFDTYQTDYKQMKKIIKENEKVREVREREYNERQMLRFGNLVDLDNLEVSGPSAQVMELQNKFQKTEKKCIKMIEDAETEFDHTQRDLTGQMKNNTNLLNLIRQLGEEELDLDKKLNDSNKAIFVDEDDEKKRHIMEEKLRIKKLLEIQAKEIETFKTEINMYKRKGGHIYTKVTTNRRVANLNQDN